MNFSDGNFVMQMKQPCKTVRQLKWIHLSWKKIVLEKNCIGSCSTSIGSGSDMVGWL